MVVLDSSIDSGLVTQCTEKNVPTFHRSRYVSRTGIRVIESTSVACPTVMEGRAQT